MGEIAFFSNKNSERKKKKERKGKREEMDNGKSAIVEIRGAESFEDRLERPFKDTFSEKAP